MTDRNKNQVMTVSTVGTAGPYIMLPVAQLDRVRELLDAHGVRYWVDETAVAVDGRNYVTIVNFGRRGDARKVQAILDAG